MLALQGTRALAREGRKLSAMVKGKAARVCDRLRSVGRTVRAISKTLALGPDRPPHTRAEDHRPVVSLSDPDARPIRKGKLGRPTEFGFVVQICEVTENTRRGCASPVS